MASISRPPMMSKKMIIGRSHSFHRERRNAKSSIRKSSIALVPVTSRRRMRKEFCHAAQVPP
ncbi:MAG TPA: hypothetical protein VNZ06_00280, partial [Steroidobacteraceae bacterium]|nr:hypothetical protein [Steroidobacteraceae bacterium]